MECLIVNFDNLGDVVFSSWISDYLSKNYDNISIDVYAVPIQKKLLNAIREFERFFILLPHGDLTSNTRKVQLVITLK